ncbi:MAG: hypothetical protein E7030_00860 [Akkermansiaceae bacterium]|nr:hypothetical protein [Akkermansiaceae bacterium]
MKSNTQVKKSTGTSSKSINLSRLPEDWEDDEERELKKLAHEASLLAWSTLSQIDKKKAAECRKKLLDDIKSSSI